MSQLRKNRVFLYKLKRQFGQKASFYDPTNTTHDILTGAITRTYDKTTIRKAIVCPKVLDRSFVYDLAFIAAAKNFTGGAFFDRNTRNIIIDASDIDFEPKIKHHLQFEGERFEIKTVETILDNAIYIIACQSLSNAETV